MSQEERAKLGDIVPSSGREPVIRSESLPGRVLKDLGTGETPPARAAERRNWLSPAPGSAERHFPGMKIKLCICCSVATARSS